MDFSPLQIFVANRFEGETVGSVAAFYMLPPGPSPESSVASGQDICCELVSFEEI